MKIDLISPHSPVSCGRRFRAAIDATLTIDTPERVTGFGTEQVITLWVHRPHVRNDMKTVLRARMEPFHGGTRIRGRVGGPRSTAIFFGCWFSFLTMFLLFGIAMSAVSLKSGLGVHDLIAVFVPIFMMAVGAFILRVGRRQARTDRDTLLAFLHRTLQARDRHDKML